MRVLVVFYFFAVVSICFLNVASASEALPILPEHKAFLLSPWDPEKPDLIVFKDPNCIYCLNQLKRRERLSAYNVFVFWAPILGNESEKKVESFFYCQSPVGNRVIQSLLQRTTLDCGDRKSDLLEKINKKIVNHYNPQSVPEYWLNGRKIDYNTIPLNPGQITLGGVVADSEIKIDWSRYNLLALNHYDKSRLSVLINFSKKELPVHILHHLQKDISFNWFANCNSKECTTAGLGTGSIVRENQTRMQISELTLLLGLKASSGLSVYLEGRLLSNNQIIHFFPNSVADWVMNAEYFER